MEVQEPLRMEDLEGDVVELSVCSSAEKLPSDRHLKKPCERPTTHVRHAVLTPLSQTAQGAHGIQPGGVRKWCTLRGQAGDDLVDL
jgi:hypothetical protein